MTTSNSEPLPTEERAGRRFGLRVERVWVWQEGETICAQTGIRPNSEAIEYMRVLGRSEVEKLAGDGIDVQQYINSLLRQVEGQRKHIVQLEATCQRYAEAMEEDGDV